MGQALSQITVADVARSGACGHGLLVFLCGLADPVPIAISVEQVAQFRNAYPDIAHWIRLVCDGNSFGDGNGDGDGHGYGSSGDGNGYGYGYGYSDGDGDGNGFGDGHGYSDGDGDGDGWI